MLSGPSSEAIFRMVVLKRNSRGGFKDPHFPLAWVMNGSNVNPLCMFDYVLQPRLGQMAPITEDRPMEFCLNTSPYFWTS